MSQREIDEKLLCVMAFTGAPLVQGTLLENAGAQSSAETFSDELSFFTTFASEGLRSFIDAFDLMKDEETPSTATTLPPSGTILPPATTDATAKLSLIGYLLPFYLRRLSRLATNLIAMTDRYRVKELGGDITPEMTDELRRLITMVNDNARPQDPTIASVLDLAKDKPWEMPDIHQKRSLKWNSEAAEIEESGQVKAAPVRSTSEFGGRKKNRNPTGFIKFNINDLIDEDESDEESKAAPKKHRHHRKSDTSDDDDSRKLRRQKSSFDDQPVEIEDADADPNWHDAKRTSVREARVRKRIPTGHPNMIATALKARMSLDMDDEDEEQIARQEELERNTKNNE